MSEQQPHLVVVTGLSGAGKTTTLHALADAGFYCVDNLPPSLAQETVRVCVESGIDRIALGMDVRVGSFLDALRAALAGLEKHPDGLTVLFLEAADEVVVRRFHETRRPHPILTSPEAQRRPLSMFEAVEIERERLASIAGLVTLTIDTSHLTVHELRRLVLARFGRGGDDASRMQIRVVSFGFKHGVPLDANLVIDARFLDNPHFVAGLREQTGNDHAVRDFVLESEGAAEFLAKLEQLLVFLLPRYEQEGKSYLTVAIGCTGGRHRSVTLAAELARRLSATTRQRVGILHRDVARGAMMSEVSVGDDDPESTSAWSVPGSALSKDGPSRRARGKRERATGEGKG
jgi:RNase adapter protein RapZ